MILSRRNFLKYSGVGALSLAGLALTACNNAETGEETSSGESSAPVEVENVDSGSTQDVSIEVEDSEKEALIAAHTTDDGKTFIDLSLIDDPASLCPYGTGASKPRTVLLQLYLDPLFQREGLGTDLQPVIGESFTYLGDKVWEVKIKEGVYDSNGNKIDAYDVAWSLWDCAVGMYNTNNIKSWFTNIEAVDATTIHATAKVEGEVTFDNRLSTNKVISQAAFEASPDTMITTPVGSGPYILTDWVSGSELVFEKNPDYWADKLGKTTKWQNANVDIIRFHVIKDSAQRVIALEAGEIDWLSQVDETDTPRFDDENHNIISAYGAQRETLYFNCSDKGHLGDVRLRQAVCYAINNEDIMLGSCGNGRLCYTTAPYTGCDYNTAWESEDYYNYNPDKALELIAECGMKPEDIQITIMTENTPELNSRIAEIMQAELGEIGITNVEIKPVDGALFSEYKYDPLSSDIIIAATGGSGDYIVTSYCSNDYKTTSEKSGLTHIIDEEWNELQNQALESEFGSDLVYQCHYYVKDHVFGYALFHPMLYFITTPILTEFVTTTTSYDAPQACRFIWND